MTTLLQIPREQALSQADHQRLHDEARLQAQVLRHEAVDDFWRGANSILVAATDGVFRSARRLSQRLARRQRRRDADTESTGV